MTTLYLELGSWLSGRVELNTSSAICQFLHNVLNEEGVTNPYSVVHVKPDTLEETVKQNDQNPGVEAVPLSACPPCLQHCELPALVTMGNQLVHCGMCSVSRKLVKLIHETRPQKKYNKLLGLHEMSLRACAEVSVWTKFCEVELPHLVEQFKQSSEIPGELLKLEHHLCQPAMVTQLSKRKHDIYNILTGKKQLPNEQCDSDWIKKMNNLSLQEFMNNNTAEVIENEAKRLKLSGKKCAGGLPGLVHEFAEGVDLTLIDLVLLPCITELLKQLEGQIPILKQKIPHVISWYKKITSAPTITQAMKISHLPIIDIPESIECDAFDNGTSGTQVKGSLAKQKVKVCTADALNVLNKLQIVPSTIPGNPWLTTEHRLDWTSLPSHVHPAQGDLPANRVTRKCEQLENIALAVKSVAKSGDRIVDFCAGGGHLGIVLAHMLPQCKILLVENKEESVRRAAERVQSLGLSNVTLYQTNLDYFHGSFDIGTCLHGCGLATDLVLHACLQVGAEFVLCPCCYGGVQNTDSLKYPQSQNYRDIMSYEDYLLLAHAADDEHAGKQYMVAVDTDRCQAAQDMGYDVALVSMTPLTCSPKNNLIVGTKNKS